MTYINRKFTWDFDSLKVFFLNYVLSPLLSLVGYYECATAASQAAKTVTASWYNKIREGGSMKIKFTHKNTAASGVTLKIGSAAAKPLYYEGAPVDATNTWDDGETVEVYFDGTSYYANNVKGSSGDGVFDLSAYNADNGVLATYADLSAALTALNALPAKYKKPCMSFKFVQSADNKYVQYRLMATSFSTTESDWQGVDDEPTDGSDNLVKSGGVYDALKPMNEEYVDFEIPATGYYLKPDGTELQNWNGAATDYIPVEKGYDFIFSCVGGVRCVVLGYDVDKLNPIQLYENTSGTKTNHIYISSSSIKYIRVSANKNDSTKYLHLMNNSTYQKIVSDMSEIKNVEYNDFEDAITGSFINTAGNVASSISGKYKDFIVYKGTKIKIIRGNIHSSQTVVGKKLSSNKYQPLVLGSQISDWPYEYVCEENMTVGISFYYGTQTYISIEFSTNYGQSALQNVIALESQNADKEQQALIQNIELGFLFNKIAVIGDSMSVATMDGYQPPLGASWLALLAKRWDCQGKEFYAAGGTTCYNWLNNSGYGLGKLIGDETIYNCYFIAYGHNDIGQYSVGEATDEAAPVTITEGVPSCPSGYSFCAYYKAIINQIRTKAPHAMIFLLSSYDNVIGGSANGAAVEDIAEWYYNNGDKLVHCLDTGGVPLSDMQIGGHYSTIGYAYIASKVNEEANKVIYQYRADEEIKSFGVYNLFTKIKLIMNDNLPIENS